MQVITALHTIIPRNIHCKEQAVLSVTMVHGGEVENVTPDEVRLGGTIRDLNPEVYDTICNRVREVVAGTCAAFGAKGTCSFDGMYPVVDNSAEQAAVVRRLGVRYLGEKRVTEQGLPMMGAEDFSYFLMQRPGCFFFLGGNEASLNGWAQYGAPGQRSNCMCHNVAFDFNDNLLPLAAVFWVRLIEDRLRANLYTEEELPMPAPPAADDDAAGAAAGSAPLPEAGSAAPPPSGPIVLNPSKKRRAA